MRLSMYKNLLPDSNSQLTLELRELVESGMCLFDPNDKYPIWDEKHRAELEKKIIDHYYMRQIGFDTPGRFKFELNVKMREIMPYYVELYKTTKFEYNPIENYNMKEESDDNSTSTAKTSAKGLEKFSDTPMGRVENIDTHLTTATKNESTGDSSGTSNNKHTAERRGNIGVTTTQQLIQAERDIIINIDLMIIDELKTLFLGVF